MAQIVGGFGVPHNPHFPTRVADGHPLADEIAGMYGGVADHLRAVAPDVLVFFTADHYNIFFEACVPIFSIGVAESAAGASDYPELPRREVPVAAELVDEATEERLAHAGNAGGELLEWIAMLGMIKARAPAFLEAQPAFGHAYAAWPA